MGTRHCRGGRCPAGPAHPPTHTAPHTLPPEGHHAPRHACPSSLGQQQFGGVSALPGQTQGLPPAAGGHGPAGPQAAPARERALQPDHHVRAGVLPQRAEKAVPARGGRRQGRGQLQHTVPQAGLGRSRSGTTRVFVSGACWSSQVSVAEGFPKPFSPVSGIHNEISMWTKDSIL